MGNKPPIDLILFLKSLNVLESRRRLMLFMHQADLLQRPVTTHIHLGLYRQNGLPVFQILSLIGNGLGEMDLLVFCTSHYNLNFNLFVCYKIAD